MIFGTQAASRIISIYKKVTCYLWKYFNALNIMVKAVLLLCLCFSLVGVCHIIYLPKIVVMDAGIIKLKVRYIAVVQNTSRSDCFCMLTRNYSYQRIRRFNDYIVPFI